MDVFFDVTRKITLRGGYRYVWGNASDVTLPLAGLTGFEQGKIRRNVAIAGLSWHPIQKAWVNLDFENGSSGSTYFRTSLYNYQKARIRGRHQISPSFSVSASASVLNNRNPSPGLNYEFLTHQESASLLYAPAGGKIWDFEGSYTRSTLRSNISYLDPEFLTTQQSFYWDNSHTITAMFDFNMPGWLGYKTKLALGGSAFLSSGSNPTTFYQPAAKLAIALTKHISWNSEWRYYGFGDSFYVYQGFRTSMVTTGVRITR
jgi:opacity protein-like surface antigen